MKLVNSALEPLVNALPIGHQQSQLSRLSGDGSPIWRMEMWLRQQSLHTIVSEILEEALDSSDFLKGVEQHGVKRSTAAARSSEATPQCRSPFLRFLCPASAQPVSWSPYATGVAA